MNPNTRYYTTCDYVVSDSDITGLVKKETAKDISVKTVTPWTLSLIYLFIYCSHLGLRQAKYCRTYLLVQIFCTFNFLHC